MTRARGLPADVSPAVGLYLEELKTEPEDESSRKNSRPPVTLRRGHLETGSLMKDAEM